MKKTLCILVILILVACQNKNRHYSDLIVNKKLSKPIHSKGKEIIFLVPSIRRLNNEIFKDKALKIKDSVFNEYMLKLYDSLHPNYIVNFVSDNTSLNFINYKNDTINILADKNNSYVALFNSSNRNLSFTDSIDNIKSFNNELNKYYNDERYDKLNSILGSETIYIDLKSIGCFHCDKRFFTINNVEKNITMVSENCQDEENFKTIKLKYNQKLRDSIKGYFNELLSEAVYPMASTSVNKYWIKSNKDSIFIKDDVRNIGHASIFELFRREYILNK